MEQVLVMWPIFLKEAGRELKRLKYHRMELKHEIKAVLYFLTLAGVYETKRNETQQRVKPQ